MTKQITIEQFIYICNEFLKDNTANSFIPFLEGKTYYTYSDGFTDTAKIDQDQLINITLNTENLNAEKFTQIVNFFVSNCNSDSIKNYNSVKNSFMRKITSSIVEQSKVLLVNQTVYDELAKDFTFIDGSITIPKSHPKRDFMLKKILKPALIVGACCGVGSAILSTLPLIANSSFVSPSTLVTIGAWASSGAVVGTVATIASTIAIKKATRNRYSKKYCAKAKNIEIMRASKIDSLAVLENSETILPIKLLMQKLHNSNEKVIKNQKGNWFQRNIINYYYKKTHRNQLWALASYIQTLRHQASNAKTTAEANLYGTLLEYIDTNISQDLRENFANFTGNSKKLNNADIYATIMKGRDKKDSLNKTKENAFDIIKQLSLEHYTDSLQPANLFGLTALISKNRNEESVMSTETIMLEDTEESIVPIQHVLKVENIEHDSNSTTTEQSVTTTAITDTVEITETPAEETSTVTINANENNDDLVAKTTERIIQRKNTSTSTAKIKECKTKYTITININGETKKVDVKKSGNRETDLALIRSFASSTWTKWLESTQDTDFETSAQTDAGQDKPLQPEQLSIF